MFEKVKSLFKKRKRYSTIFASNGSVKIYSPSEEDKHILKASFEKLRPYLPTEVDLDKNYDLIGFTTPAAVANKINLNDQYLDGGRLKHVAHLWKFKMLNWEHDPSTVIGCCTNYHWAEFGSDTPITEEQVDELIAKKEPFTLVLSGYIWTKALDDDQIQKIEASNDPTSEFYGKLSSSWEVFFNEFNIGVKDRYDSSISFITDEQEILAKKNSLKHFRGSGLDLNGNTLFLNLLDSDLLPSGLGLTISPAASVKGALFTLSTQIPTEESQEENDESVINATQNNTMKVKADDDELERDEDEIKEKEKKAEKGKKDYSDKQREHFEENKVEIEEEEDDDDEVEGRKKKKIAVNEEGKSDETKWGPTKSPIVDTAFSKLTDIESRLKTTIKAFSKNNLNDAQIKARFELLKTVDLKEVFSWDESNFETNYCDLVASFNQKSEKSVNNLEKNEKLSVKQLTASNSQNKNNEKQTNMKLEKLNSLDEVTDEKLIAGEITAGVIATFLEGHIDKLGADWAAKEKAKADALALATENASSIGTKLATVEAELETLKNEAVAREKAEVFNTRIAALAEDFEFSDEQREIVASEIKDLDSESFDKYLKKLELFAKKKMKQGEKDKEDEKLGDEVSNLKKEVKKDAKASEVFANLQVDADQVIPPNAAAPLESLKERWAAGFTNGGVKVTKG